MRKGSHVETLRSEEAQMEHPELRKGPMAPYLKDERCMGFDAYARLYYFFESAIIIVIIPMHSHTYTYYIARYRFFCIYSIIVNNCVAVVMYNVCVF